MACALGIILQGALGGAGLTGPSVVFEVKHADDYGRRIGNGGRARFRLAGLHGRRGGRDRHRALALRRRLGRFVR